MDWPRKGYPRKDLEPPPSNVGTPQLPTVLNERKKWKDSFFYFGLFDEHKKLSPKVKSISLAENNFYVPQVFDYFADIFGRKASRRAFLKGEDNKGGGSGAAGVPSAGDIGAEAAGAGFKSPIAIG